MKRVLLIAGVVAISTAAFAQANGPVRQGNKCWAVTDQQRGFGFWDNCADGKEIAARGKQDGRRGMFDESRTVGGGDIGNGGGGGGGGGGGR